MIHELAVYLAGPDVPLLSAALAIPADGDRGFLRRQAEQWARMREATPLHGWVNVEEAEKLLLEFLL